jgi:hypothetical protein
VRRNPSHRKSGSRSRLKVNKTAALQIQTPSGTWRNLAEGLQEKRRAAF